MKNTYLALVTLIYPLLSFQLQAQTNYQSYRQKQDSIYKVYFTSKDSVFNAYREQREKEFTQYVKINDSLFSIYLNEEHARLNIYKKLGAPTKDKKNEIIAVEQKFPKESTPITLADSEKKLADITKVHLDSSKTETREQKKRVSQNKTVEPLTTIKPKAIDSSAFKVDNNVQLATIDSNSIELAMELNANRPIFSPLPKGSYRMSSEFSEARMHPKLKIVRPHEGIDLSAKAGIEIIAPAKGVVIASKKGGEAGNMIVIDHQNGFSTTYMHLHERKVKKGQKVKLGEVIGTVGATGKYTTKSHLHYEIRKNGDAFNPAPFIAKHFK